MSIKVKQTSMVKPAEETPRRKLWLSSLDLYISRPNTYIPSVQFYRCPNDDVDNINDPPNNFFMNAEKLKEALSKALVPFYPLAGRLIINDHVHIHTHDHDQENINGRRMEIDCNGEGAMFIEAETQEYSLADFEQHDFTPTDEMLELVVPKFDCSGGLSSFPLLIVQLTRFSCGGVALGLAQNHQIGDGAAYLHFIVSWSRLARGLDLDFPPVIDRASYFAPRCPRSVPFYHLEYDDPPLPIRPLQGDLDIETATTSVGVCKFSKEQINALKLEATLSQEETQHKLSTFEVLAGHIWRSVCKARGLAQDQDVKLSIPVDGRSRLSLPQGYFGNVIFHAACMEKAGDITGNPLWYAATQIHKAVKKMKDEEYLRSAIDYLESQPDIMAIARGTNTYKFPKLLINSWARLPYHEADFGWAGPIFGGNGGIRSEGQCFVLQSPDGDGSFLVTAKLFTPHMILFKKYMYEF